MILSGHQPVYLPGIILFNKIALSDEFMFVGHCDYGAKSWHSHNQIRGARLTVPVRHDSGPSINATEIDGTHWKRKHLRSIELAYSKRPFFGDYFDGIKRVIESPCRWLGPLNMELTKLFCGWLGLEARILDRDFPINGHKTDMLISMCELTGANEYLSNEGARDYVDELKMARHGITHLWQKFTHPVYDQGHAEFITNLSIIDLLFNCGPEAGRKVREAGRKVRECGYVE